MVGMGRKGTSYVNIETSPRRGFMNSLASAVCEWLLIFLLFVDAAFSYFLTKFAHYCELKPPCLLCSRLDHVLGNEKPGFYQSLLCSNHRVEISSLISCHIHGKLADACDMCEECLVSVATHSKSYSEACRLVLGKLGVDFQNSFLNKDLSPGSLSRMVCSCCNKTWRTRSNAQRLLQLNPIGFGASKANIKPPLPRFPGRSRLSRRDSFKKIRDKFSGPASPRRVGNTGVDPLSHVGYTELKITSDSESEVPFSDDDDGSSFVREQIDPKDDLFVKRDSRILPETQSNGLAPVKQTQESSNSNHSLLDQIDLDLTEPHEVKCPESDVVIGYGLEELNWDQANPKPNPSVLLELISLDDVPPSSTFEEVSICVSAYKPDALSELILVDDTSSSNTVKIPPGEPMLDVIGSRDIGHTSVSEHAELSELLSTTDGADKIHEDSVLLQQVLSTRGVDLSLNITSPRMYGHREEPDRSDISGSIAIGLLQNSLSLERNDSGCESLDGSSVSEIEGESVIDRLKRQVKYDRKCMSDLYKELEEERGASTVAANQAMAMITRLQEEKAALHMEALQYLRMMEEQAEYDMEALEKANDLLAEKEKEVQDLEAELELFRNNLQDESMVLHGENNNSTHESLIVEKNGVPPHSTAVKMSEGNDMSIGTKTLLLDFEEEKLYISQCLKKLERKLHQVSTNAALTHMPNGGFSETSSDGLANHEEILIHRPRTDPRKEENSLSIQKDLYVINGSISAQDEDNDFSGEENNHFDSDGKKLSRDGGEVDVVALENEILDLNDRLEALEADRDFLEHALNSLQNGTEGLHFILEIVHQLQELRKIGTKEKCHSVP